MHSSPSSGTTRCSTRFPTACSGWLATAPASTSGRTSTRRFSSPPEEAIGRNVYDLLPAELATTVLACIDRTLETRSLHTIEYEIEIDGVARWKEARMVPSGDSEVVSISRDFTELRRAEAEERRLGAEQAALRRVATLVAGNAPPEQVFQTVTEEVCRLLGLRTAVLHRFQDARTSIIVGKFGDPTGPFEVGNVNELEVGSALQVLQSGAPARSDYDELVGSGASKLRDLGFCRQRRRADHGGRRDLGCSRRRPPARREPAARDRAPSAGVRRARRPRGRERRCARRARRLATTHRRGERHRAAAAGTQPARRRAAATRRTRGRSTARPGKAAHIAGRGRAPARRVLERARPGHHRAARAGAGHPPGGAHGTWARRCARGAGGAGAARGRPRRLRAGGSARAGRDGDLLHHLRGARQRRQACRRRFGRGASRLPRSPSRGRDRG